MKSSVEKMNDLLRIIEKNCKDKMFYHSFYILCKGLAIAAEKGNKSFIERYLDKFFGGYIYNFDVDASGNFAPMTEIDPEYVLHDITSTITDFGYAVTTVAIESGAR